MAMRITISASKQPQNNKRAIEMDGERKDTKTLGNTGNHFWGSVAGKLNLDISASWKLGCQAASAGPSWPLAQCPSPRSHSRYEDEINKRTAAENEFVTLKKVSR